MGVTDSQVGAARLITMIASLATLILFALPAAVDAARPSFEAGGVSTIQPAFDWKVRDYAAHCADGSLRLRIDGARGWTTKLPGEKPQRGNVVSDAELAAGQAAKLAFRRDRKGGESKRFTVRCLPADFPAYSFERKRPGGAKLLMVQLPNYYAAIFDGDGVPVWWMQTDGFADDAKVLPDRTISWNTVVAGASSLGAFDIRSLTGRPIRTVGDDESTDVHDLQLLPNGNYVIAKQVYRTDVDASAYGGLEDGAVIDYEIQEVTPDGEVVRSWSTADHIGLDETGRWWATITPGLFLYDITHWNAVEVEGRHMYLSFRHLDAIYKVDRRTGEIVWKLGGTETPESLEVLDDPREYPIGGQHDVRVQPNGTITIHNNRTNLSDPQPRAERFRIDEDAGTATLVESVTDSKVPASFCCGSARRLEDRSWLVSWGGNEVVGAYDQEGRPIYRLRLGGAFSYRANPVTEVGRGDLRIAMDRMSR